MANVLGIGGVFFKSRDPKALASWYAAHLGLSINDFGGVAFTAGALPASAYCVWGPFAESTKYFEPSTQSFMINLVVDDLEQVLAQAAAGGAQIIGTIEKYEYGSFGWFLDPDGNKIELWQPRDSVRPDPLP